MPEPVHPEFRPDHELTAGRPQWSVFVVPFAIAFGVLLLLDLLHFWGVYDDSLSLVFYVPLFTFVFLGIFGLARRRWFQGVGYILGVVVEMFFSALAVAPFFR